MHASDFYRASRLMRDVKIALSPAWRAPNPRCKIYIDDYGWSASSGKTLRAIHARWDKYKIIRRCQEYFKRNEQYFTNSFATMNELGKMWGHTNIIYDYYFFQEIYIIYLGVYNLKKRDSPYLNYISERIKKLFVVCISTLFYFSKRLIILTYIK